MTEHVRKSYRGHRRATWAGALVVAIVAALAAAVLPATGATGDPTGLPSDPLGVQPFEDASGGNTFACPSGLNQFKINNPKSGSYSTTVGGVPVSFTLTASGSPNKDKYLSFRATNAAVQLVAINGGTKTAVYKYGVNLGGPGAALADGYGSGTINPLAVDTSGSNGKIGLHAPVDSAGVPFSLSYTTFCFTLPTLEADCDSPMQGTSFPGAGGTVTYRAQFVAQGGDCKDGEFVMYSNAPAPSTFFATLFPVVPGGPDFEVVENIQWTGIAGNAQNPVTLWYDDTPPFDGADKRTMVMCDSDPRPDPIGDPFNLDGNDPGLPGTHTTCMLRSTDIAGGSYDSWLYTTIDGGRGMG